MFVVDCYIILLRVVLLKLWLHVSTLFPLGPGALWLLLLQQLPQGLLAWPPVRLHLHLQLVHVQPGQEERLRREHKGTTTVQQHIAKFLKILKKSATVGTS